MKAYSLLRSMHSNLSLGFRFGSITAFEGCEVEAMELCETVFKQRAVLDRIKDSIDNILENSLCLELNWFPQKIEGLYKFLCGLREEELLRYAYVIREFARYKPLNRDVFAMLKSEFGKIYGENLEGYIKKLLNDVIRWLSSIWYTVNEYAGRIVRLGDSRLGFVCLPQTLDTPLSRYWLRKAQNEGWLDGGFRWNGYGGKGGAALFAQYFCENVLHIRSYEKVFGGLFGKGLKQSKFNLLNRESGGDIEKAIRGFFEGDGM